MVFNGKILWTTSRDVNTELNNTCCILTLQYMLTAMKEKLKWNELYYLSQNILLYEEKRDYNTPLPLCNQSNS